MGSRAISTQLNEEKGSLYTAEQETGLLITVEQGDKVITSRYIRNGVILYTRTRRQV